MHETVLWMQDTNVWVNQANINTNLRNSLSDYQLSPLTNIYTNLRLLSISDLPWLIFTLTLEMTCLIAKYLSVMSPDSDIGAS
jgi:hypothetical protein